MPRRKYDGLIEAVRYATNGKIDMVRVYERRGAVFSDRILLDRDTLIDRLKKHRQYVTGKRKPLWAGTFEADKTILISSDPGQFVITTGESGKKDQLAGVPLF